MGRMLAQETPRGAEILSKVEDKSQNRPLVVIRVGKVAKKFTIERSDGEVAEEICYVSKPDECNIFRYDGTRPVRTDRVISGKGGQSFLSLRPFEPSVDAFRRPLTCYNQKFPWPTYILFELFATTCSEFPLRRW